MTLLTICTAFFAVLSCVFMTVFKLNETYFDTHGRLGTLTKTEQESMREEQIRMISSKRNVDVSILDEKGGRLFLPLTREIPEESISVREEFANHKLVITLSGGEDLILPGTQVVTDSSIMHAVGIYGQEDTLVLEIYQNSPYGYEVHTTQNGLELCFVDWRDLYDWMAVVYIPFEQKERLYSEDWMHAFDNLNEGKSKVFVCSSMQEAYTQQQIVDFANEISADLLFGISYENTTMPEQFQVIYNPDFFIPEFGSVELSVLAREQIEDKVKLYASGYIKSEEKDVLVHQARVPAAYVTCFVQADKETIEERYTRNHNMMEAISSIIKESAPKQDTAQQEK